MRTMCGKALAESVWRAFVDTDQSSGAEKPAANKAAVLESLLQRPDGITPATPGP